MSCVDTVVINAVATVALALIAAVAIIANWRLVRGTNRMAKATEAMATATEKSVELQQRQFDLAEKEFGLTQGRVAAEEQARRDDVDRITGVDLEITGPSGSVLPAAGGIMVSDQRVHVRNNGPGTAHLVQYGLRTKAGGTEPARLDVLRAGREHEHSFRVPQDWQARPEDATVWVTYTDDLGRAWEVSRVGSQGALRRVQRDALPGAAVPPD